MANPSCDLPVLFENFDVVLDTVEYKQDVDLHFFPPQSPDKWLNTNLTLVKGLIAGNLTCMRLAPLKGES